MHSDMAKASITWMPKRRSASSICATDAPPAHRHLQRRVRRSVTALQQQAEYGAQVTQIGRTRELDITPEPRNREVRRDSKRAPGVKQDRCDIDGIDMEHRCGIEPAVPWSNTDEVNMAPTSVHFIGVRKFNALGGTRGARGEYNPAGVTGLDGNPWPLRPGAKVGNHCPHFARPKSGPSACRPQPLRRDVPRNVLQPRWREAA